MNTALTFILAAAAGITPLRAAESDPQMHQNHGITYVIPAQKRHTAESTVNSYMFKGESLTIKWLEGALTVNGKNYGRVVSGDKVTISATGGVSVNGKERIAQ